MRGQFIQQKAEGVGTLGQVCIQPRKHTFAAFHCSVLPSNGSTGTNKTWLEELRPEFAEVEESLQRLPRLARVKNEGPRIEFVGPAAPGDGDKSTCERACIRQAQATGR